MGMAARTGELQKRDPPSALLPLIIKGLNCIGTKHLLLLLTLWAQQAFCCSQIQAKGRREKRERVWRFRANMET